MITELWDEILNREKFTLQGSATRFLKKGEKTDPRAEILVQQREVKSAPTSKNRVPAVLAKLWAKFLNRKNLLFK